MTTPTIERHCHWLRPNRRSRRPELIVFVDCESTETVLRESVDLHTLQVGWACLARYKPNDGLQVIGWHEIKDAVDFWHIISGVAVDHKCTYIVSHNIDFDARILRAFSVLPGIGWTPAYVILSPSCRFFKFTSGKNAIVLLDNLNYWHTDLASLGVEFGIAKTSIDFATATPRELSEYCQNDVRILVRVWDYWLRFLDEHDLGDFSISVAGQALRAFRHRFMPKEIGIHNRADAIRLERASYKGGRCSVFKVGKFVSGPYYKLDINGLYAYCMREYPTPRKLVKVLVDVCPEYLAKLLEKYLVIADCILETDIPYYAIHQKGYNIFPIGGFRATLTTREVEYALAHNHIKAVGEVAIYTGGILFKSFVDYFTPLRQKYKAAGDTARSAICKMLRNSLYGKFGQRGYKQKKIGEAPLHQVSMRQWIDLETQAQCTDWTFGGVVIRNERSGESQDSFPGIASHIAATGRIVLFDYIQKAGIANVLYADTDSLFVNQAGYDKLVDWIDPLELGKLKLEGISGDLEILAKKSYVFDSKRVSKGIRKNAVLLQDGIWQQTHFTSLKWAFKQGNLDNVVTYEVQKHEQNTITHGMVDIDGNVHPPQMSMKQENVMDIIEPRSSYAWDWWVDVPWLQNLAPRNSSLSLVPRFWPFAPRSVEPPPGF